MTITRFDIPGTVRNTIRAALEHKAIDSITVYALATKHGDNWKELVSELCEIAYTMIHWNGAAHTAVVKAAEQYWIEMLVA